MHSVKPDTTDKDRVDTDVIEYRAVSVLALFGLLLALASVLAFGHPVLWIVPLASVLVSLLALRRIAENSPRLLGRKVAILSLAIALALGAAATARSVALIACTRYETRLVCREWFKAVLHNQLETALELMQTPGARQPPGDDLAAHYRDDPSAATALRAFAALPLVRALRVIDGDATVSYLGTEEEVTLIVNERVASLWAITYEKDGQRMTFLARVSLKRSTRVPRLVNLWEIEKVYFVDTPPDWL